MAIKRDCEKSRIFLEKFVDFFENVRIIVNRMDTKNHIGFSGPELRNRKLVVGVKQLKKALGSGIASQVFLAENADPALTEPLQDLCLQKQIPFAWVATMSDLGRACGIDVGAAAAAVID